MALNILRGPAGAGKSQWLARHAPTALVLDVTALWAALTGVERDEHGRYPIRTEDEDGLRMALYLKAVGTRFAAEQGIEAWVTTSSSAPEAVERIWERVDAANVPRGRIHTIDPGYNRVRKRLADPITGELSEECEQAVNRWFVNRARRR